MDQVARKLASDSLQVIRYDQIFVLYYYQAWALMALPDLTKSWISYLIESLQQFEAKHK